MIRRLILGLSLLSAGAAAVAADQPPPVRMAPYRVAGTMLDIKVVIRWKQSGFVGQYVDGIRVGAVKKNSIAARAGLVRGMDILSIQGQDVRGLSQDDLARVLQQEVAKEVVLVVRRSDKAPPQEIHLPVVNR